MTPEDQQKFNELKTRKAERRDKIQKLRQLRNEKIQNEDDKIQRQIDKIEAEDTADTDKVYDSLSS